MKVKSIMIIMISIFIILCYNKSCATDTAKVYLNTEKNIYEKGEEIELKLYIEDIKTAAFTTYIYFDDLKLDYISGPDNVNIDGNRIIYVWYDSNGGESSKKGELANFRFKAKENGIAEFYINGEFYDNSSKVIDTNFENLQVQIGTTDIEDRLIQYEESEYHLELSNTNLEILAIENVLLNPPFDNNITHYDVEVSKDTNDLNILAVPEDEKGAIEIKGGENLKQGNNLVKVLVTSPDGKSKKIYEVNVYKRDEKEEKKYEEEQKENQEKLEKIYKTQRTSNLGEDIQESNASYLDKNENKDKKSNPLVLIIVGTLIILIVFCIYKKINNKNSNNN
ncbi:MAG: hypothetical protein HFJ17_04995 [Clostridia bacterium]|nr:hypothetical protein [Clostridia bacterium]